MLEMVTTRPPFQLKLPVAPRRYLGLVLSLGLHAVLIALLVLKGEEIWSRTASSARSAAGQPDGGGGGGGAPQVTYITLPSIPKPETPQPRKAPSPIPTPRPVVTPVVREPEPAKVVAPTPVDAAPPGPALASSDTVRGNGAGTGGGKPGEPGQGQGRGSAGVGAGPGGGAKVRPPEPRDMAFPFDKPPKELRGLSLNVTFWVRRDGKVERYLVEPEIKDRDYAKKFDEVMRAFRFTPARAPDGTSIPGTTRISFTLPGKSSS
jgi:hypothetical protein